MWIVAIAWSYVVVMMAVAEALAPNGTVLGAVFTLLLYGVLPLWVVLYIGGTRARRARRNLPPTAPRAGPPEGDARLGSGPAASRLAANPDGSSHAAGDAAVPPERKEP
jgi:hypothetical protein